jgi:hypothetical protein
MGRYRIKKEAKNVTLIKLPLKTPRYWELIRIVQLGNGKSIKDVVDYRFTPDFKALGGVRYLHNQGIPLRSLASLAEVLQIVGPYAKLWVGTYKGTIAPMDVQPMGWVYGNGDEYEPENFWQWTPDEQSEKAMLSDMNTILREGMQSLLKERETIFKNLLSYQSNQTYGKVLEINAIPIQDLARLIKQEIDWVFEFEHQT